MHFSICTCRNLVNLGWKLKIFWWKKKTVSWKIIHDPENWFSDKSLWLSPCLLPEMYVFTFVRKRGVILTDFTYTRCILFKHLNMECFESAVPAIFLSYAPTFFNTEVSKVWRGFMKLMGIYYPIIHLYL